MKPAADLRFPVISAPPPPNVRAPSYFLALATTKCWKCRRPIRVQGLGVPETHETLDLGTPGATWRRSNQFAMLAAVEAMSNQVAERLCSGNPHFRRVLSRQAGFPYFMNHCGCCESKQGDLKLHETPGGAFNPTSREAAELITLVEIPEVFEGHARRLFLSPPLLDCMRVYRR